MKKVNYDKVLLVDEQDNFLGVMDKMEAHEKALLHRAFSVFILNDQGEIMMQQRALHKYHSPGLWTNTCCSHQQEGETNVQAAERRLKEEMGFSTRLEEAFSFIYKAPFDNGLTEHEFDHVLIGYYNQAPEINPTEVADWKWMSTEEIQHELKAHPHLYTEWFKIIFDRFYHHLNDKISTP